MSISRSHSNRESASRPQSRRNLGPQRRLSDGANHLIVPGAPLRRVPSQRTSGRLCAMCLKIDFDRYLVERMRPKSLGLLRDVLRRNYCPFCRLVVRCLGDDLGTSITDEFDQFVLIWTKLSWVESEEILGWDGARSSSYSNKYDLRSTDKGQSGTRAYRFMVGLDSQQSSFRGLFREELPDVLGQIQYLADKERVQADRVFFGRMINQDRVDSSLLRSWLDRCGHWHRGRCDVDVYAPSNLPRSLRFIDVQARRVVEASSQHEYVALSYVWGEAAMLEASGMEMPKLLRKDICRGTNGDEYMPLPDRLPRTLEDALTVARLLGYDFLWNDALCIVQDDDADTKQIHLQAMDAIYSRAALTIAAASGAHADYGLPGISMPRRHEQFREKVNGLRLASMFPAFSNIEDWNGLVWNTRGWTLQEKLLSKRILFFTDWQVYFKCSEAIWTEEVCSETGRLSKSIQSRPNKYGWAADRLPRNLGNVYGGRHVPAMFKGIVDSAAYHVARMDTRDSMAEVGFLVNYCSLVERFSRRRLSHQSDCLFAIEGILRTFNAPLFAGLPGRFFEQALLWHCNAALAPQAFHETTPSWSWTSCCSRDFQAHSRSKAAMVSWSETDLLDTVRSIDRYSVKRMKNFENAKGVDLHNKATGSDPIVYSALQPVSKVQYLHKGSCQRISRDSDNKHHARPIERSDAVPRHAYQLSFTKPLLRIEGWVLSLRVKKCSHNCPNAQPVQPQSRLRDTQQALLAAHDHLLIDRQGRCCGEVTTPCHIPLMLSSGGTCTLLVVSWSRSFRWVKKQLDPKYIPMIEETRTRGEGEQRQRYTVDVEQNSDSWIVANVLLIVYSTGVAYRVGIGKVIVTAFQNAKPREETVILG